MPGQPNRALVFVDDSGVRWPLYASFFSPFFNSFRIPASTSFRFLPHRMREVFSTSR